MLFSTIRYKKKERNPYYFDNRASVCISLLVLFGESTEQIIWMSHFPQVPPSILRLILKAHMYLNLKPEPQRRVNIPTCNPRDEGKAEDYLHYCGHGGH